MTNFIDYQSLTWPQVAQLPRHTPLVLPLGSGYDLERLADGLGHPPQIALLPPIPFGWRGSGLAVPEAALAPLLANLLDSLREDGFTRVYALTPQSLDLSLGTERIALPHPGQQQSTSAIPTSDATGQVVLLPIGHTEQHGHHLPLCTDTTIIQAIAQGTVDQRPGAATSLPVFPYGVSTHRASFAGTLNAGGRAFEDFWLAVVDLLVQRGFDRFYLLSGHGGNCSFLANVVKWTGERHRRVFCATAWLHTAGHIASPIVEQYRRSERGGMGHAGELETAMMLHLQPDQVQLDRAVDETDYIATESFYMDWIEGGALIANPPWDDDSATGAYGAGSLATAANGHRWLQAAIDEKAAHVDEIHLQQQRRQQRRAQGFGLWGQAPAERPSS
ncbi:MAG: hypothetical protein GKR89_05065 [Candidatus Latescibacteria bacterium]|nr:hypothetical protein [Candidatus Latescibacterota bacterium]